MISRLRGLADLALDVLLPRSCAGCGAGGTWLCIDCLRLLAPGPRPCPACGATRPDGARCPRCAEPLAHIDRLRAGWAYLGPAVGAVRELKYHGRRALLPQFAHALARPLTSLTETGSGTAVLVPVPLHPRRAAQRGFNQSLLLARAASELLGLDVSDCLVRTRDTAPQVRLSIGERLDNLHGAFTGMGHAPPWAILVDDVCTTGATLSAAARALRACGSRRVDAAVLCRG